MMPRSGRVPGRRAALGALAIGLAALAPLAIADWRSAPRGEGPESAAVRRIDGEPYLAANDLARLLDATKFWRADARKLVLRSGRHSITLTVDNPFVVVNESTVWLPAPVRSTRGELQVPVALVDSLPADSSLARLHFDAGRQRVLVLPASGGIGTPSVSVQGGATRITFPADDPASAVVVARSRDHFRFRIGGLFTGSLPESLPAGGMVRSIRSIASVGGTAFECRIGREAGGFRLLPDPDRRRVVLEFVGERSAAAESFAAEGPSGPRTLRVIVLDPGHGGADPGVIAGDAVEKDLALALARRLKTELEQRLPARVVLTRDDDRALTPDERAEIANRAHADLVLSLHFDGFPGTRASGATAYCPPATIAAPGLDAEAAAAAAGDPRVPRSRPVVLLPWRDVALRHAVASRLLAEALLSALELRGQGPTRLRERLATPLLGVNAPCLLLECAALTAPADRDRVSREAGIRDLAATLAEGIEAWQRNE